MRYFSLLVFHIFQLCKNMNVANCDIHVTKEGESSSMDMAETPAPAVQEF